MSGEVERKMRLLFCCEYYHPSVGGVQEVMRQIAERMVLWGHDVTVLTTRLDSRSFNELHGVKIEEFSASGNAIVGMEGELDRYREFVLSYKCDALLVKAAQQWTFDALCPVLDKIEARKIFIPCGFSGLYEPAYQEYYKKLPSFLKSFEHLIFYTSKYRDIDFARAHGLVNWSVVPNGASEVEFSVSPEPSFRARLGIPENSFLFLTVGSLTGKKGHVEIAEAFSKLRARGRHVTLLMNGNVPLSPKTVKSNFSADLGKENPDAMPPPIAERPSNALRYSEHLKTRLGRIFGLAWRSIGVLRREGWQGVGNRIAIIREGARSSKNCQQKQESLDLIRFWLDRSERQKNKLVLRVDLPRTELVQAYMAADLFVFASNVEYSPLVLFESAAAGTPFLSVPVGNTEEIAAWTGGGVICEAPRDELGYVRVVPAILAKAMENCMHDPTLLRKLGKTGKDRWAKNFTWADIGKKYEKILCPCLNHDD